MTPREQLEEIVRQLDAKNHFNGGQTVRDRYPLGSEQRARLVAEAAFWLEMAREDDNGAR